MLNLEKIIDHYNLLQHPEGGFYREIYRSAGTFSQERSDELFPSGRNYSTAIYFLLPVGSFSAFHRIKSDEIWHFYQGCSLIIHVIDKNGMYTKLDLGSDIEKGQSFQLVVTANSWFASEPNGQSGEYSFVGCTVSPGFDFNDFELADANSLASKFPIHERIIRKLTR